MPKYNLFLKCSQIKIYNFNLIIVFELTKTQFAFKCKIKHICELKFGDQTNLLMHKHILAITWVSFALTVSSELATSSGMNESAMKSSIAGALLASLVLYISQIFLTK